MEIVLNLLILIVLVIITYNLFSKNKKSNASIDSDTCLISFKKALNKDVFTTTDN